MATAAQVATARQFQYTPLSDETREIRLLKLEHDRSAEESDSPSPGVTCTLRHVALDARPTYFALSYTWGDKYPQTTVDVDGKAFPISHGLGTFLEQAQRLQWLMESELYLWVDQISINQENTEEKGRQVALMAEIYSQAAEVLVWLGPAADDSDHALRAIHLRDYENTKASQESLRALFRRRYWFRLWIVQELVRARDGRLLCGANDVSITDFFDFVHTLPRNQEHHYFDMQEPWIVSHWVLTICFERYRSDVEHTLPLVVENFQAFQCVDVRDKVYGLQAIIPSELRVPVDYSLDTVGLWLAVMRKVKADHPDMKAADYIMFAQVMEGILGVYVLEE